MLSPKRPYFLRAMHEWLSDNGFTPYLMVNATHPELLAPTEYAQDGKLVLAISYQATNNLLIGNDGLSFQGRFGGVSKDIWVPISAVIGIYAKEEPSEGLFFDPSEYDGYTPPDDNLPDDIDDSDDDSDDEPPKKGGHLKFV